MPRRSLALAGAVLTACLAFAPWASAEEPPSVDSVRSDIATLACVDGEVAGLADLNASLEALVGLGLTNADLDVLQGERDAAVAALDCGATEEPPTEQPPGEEPPMEEPTVEERVAAVRAEIDALDCDGFGEQLGAIQDEQRALIGEASGQQLGALADALNARLRVLGFCADPAEPTTSTPAPSTTVVTPLPVDRDVTVVHTDDDDSTANATQVRVVPEGSVATGAA